LSHADCGEATRARLNATAETVAVVNQAIRVQLRLRNMNVRLQAMMNVNRRLRDDKNGKGRLVV